MRSTDNSILSTKLHMQNNIANIIARPRLWSTLQKGLSYKITFICAPAGFGKTTLLSQWLRDIDTPVAWVSLDDGDNDLSRFWSYVVSAFDQAYPGLKQKLHSIQFHQGYEPFVATLLNVLGRLQAPVVLALDDFHLIRDLVIHQSVAYFIEHLPGHIHIYIASRTEPGFPSARLENREMMFRVEAEELRFAVREGIDFYKDCMNLTLSDDEAMMLVQRTEGWIAAMKLAALTIRKRDWVSVFVHNFSGRDQSIEKYLLEEVFELQDESIRVFLMNCSVLSRMSAPLCQAVSGRDDSRSVLEYLYRAHLFTIPLDEEHCWFRFHHLFAEFLGKQLDNADPHKASELRALAGGWCEQQELEEEAVDYYIAGGHYERAAALLERMTGRVVGVGWTRLCSWLSGFPEPFLWQRPSLFVTYLLASFLGNGKEEPARLLMKGEQIYQAHSETWTEEERQKYLGGLHLVRSTSQIITNQDRLGAFQSFQAYLESMPSTDSFIYGMFDMPLQASALQLFQSARGQFGKAVAVPFFKKLLEIVADMNQWISASVCISYAELLYEWNELEEAERHVHTGLRLAEQIKLGTEQAFVSGWLLMARLKGAAGKREEAINTLLEAKKRFMERDIPGGMMYADHAIARIEMQSGDVQLGQEWLNRYGLSDKDAVSVIHMHDYLFVARVFMALGYCEEAMTLCGRLLELAVREQMSLKTTEILLVQALLSEQAGKPEDAILKLEEALRWAEPDDSIRLFVDEGEPLRKMLLMYIRKRQSRHIRHMGGLSLHYVRKVLHGFLHEVAYIEVAAAGFDEILTGKEQRVLELMREGLSNREIAEQLQIGYGTLKTHVNHLYSKLHVNSRVEAVRRSAQFPYKN
ncbi:LuxR C-terminal-related transcriptional regulator [Paenibacillus sp. WQ 127069]|uniref:LuxR C-terminal-related transcriptional regulator n=1 Tax=Paenibacillus baimaensis TaxID=2982185 RepID=A0ABT2UV24_9BACL|nr:LuxR C-terminal-related transcriptional regulator [Paenibacillus sp. WQ 127069]MCU6797876.1 LuxR C-terminal-related transcriptional regulator [Paenibacillus sp. WQ 127069]